MGLTVKSSFAAGELDPKLHERTTLDKYKSGLKTCRNWLVTETGNLATRNGRLYFKEAKLDDREILIFSPPGSGLLIEWGHEYARAYDYATGTLSWESSHDLTESDIPNIHYDFSGSYFYIWCAGKPTIKVKYTDGTVYQAITADNPFDQPLYYAPTQPTSSTITENGVPAGLSVQYAITFVYNGEESTALYDQGSAHLPIAAGQTVTVEAVSPFAAGLQGVSEMKVYRRFAAGGAYGYVGSSTLFGTSGGFIKASFIDFGQDADYTHSPVLPVVPTPFYSAIGVYGDGSYTLQSTDGLLSKTGVVYQQRLLISDYLVDLEAIFASRPGFQKNFTQNFPIDAASALRFKCGTSGRANILRMLDSDGLVVFTTAGIFLNQGPLGPTNITMDKKGEWVVNEFIPPLPVPGGVLFLDASSNSVRNLTWSLERNKFDAEQVSIYSQHLFRRRSVTSWNFQRGAFPVLYVVFSDGKFATFTFEFDQQMKAWTRHDSDSAITVERSCQTIEPDLSFFVVKKGTKRYIEHSIPRYMPVSELDDNPEADKGKWIARMDSMVTQDNLINDMLDDDDEFTLSPTDGDGSVWDDTLIFSCDGSGVFGDLETSLGFLYGETLLGKTFRHFNPVDRTVTDLFVTELVDDNTVKVMPRSTFPSEYAVGGRFYLCYNHVDGLQHMEGENVAVVVDGAVVASPYNDQQNYPTLTVDNGRITLPDDMLGAIIHVGRPIVADVETLNIDTVEQSPQLIESILVNKLYIKTFEASGLYVGNKFPKNDLIKGLEQLDQYLINPDNTDDEDDSEVIGNRYQEGVTNRYEVSTPGDWKAQGRVCIRIVDPIHAEILSIIPDVEMLKRSDR